MRVFNDLNELSDLGCAVLQVDPQTGTPLDDSLNWANKGNEAYYFFESEEIARNYAKGKVEEDPLSEWCLFNNKGEQIGVYRNKEALLLEASKKRRKSGFFRRFFNR